MVKESARQDGLNTKRLPQPKRGTAVFVSALTQVYMSVFFFPDLVLLIERNPTALVHSHSFTQNVPNVSNHLLKLTVAKSLRSYFRS